MILDFELKSSRKVTFIISRKFKKAKLDLLMGLVIAFIIIVGAYVGYHASQVTDTGEAHNIKIDSQVQTYDLQINGVKQEPSLVLS